MNKVMVVAPHGDDELLGAGIAIQRHVENGDDVYVAVMCRRSYGHMRIGPEHSTDRVDCEHVMRALHVQMLWGDLVDERLESMFVDALIFLEKCWEQVKPSIVYMPNPGDINQDHWTTARACRIVARPYVQDQSIRTLLAYEVPGSTDTAAGFMPNWYVRASAREVDRKCSLMSMYGSEVRQYPHPRSAEAIKERAALRGQEVGAHWAEAFMLVRHSQ